MNEPARHNCPVCRESIRPDARECPHCHTWQGRLQRLLAHPFTGVAFIFGVFVIVFPLAIWAAFGQMLAFGADFPPYQDKVAVEDVQFELHQEEDERPRITVTGSVHNNSARRWEDLELEIRFFDDAGELVQVEHDRLLWMTLHREQTRSFSATFNRRRSEDRYADVEVHVGSAREAVRL